jgi:hypothetical protein
MVLNPITRERRTLATVHRAGPDDFYVRSLAWTAGGNAVVFLATTGERVEFRLAPLDGGAVRVLQEWPGVPHVGAGAIVDGFDVSPDGRRLAFVATEGGPGVFLLEHPLADVPKTTDTAPR